MWWIKSNLHYRKKFYITVATLIQQFVSKKISLQRTLKFTWSLAKLKWQSINKASILFQAGWICFKILWQESAFVLIMLCWPSQFLDFFLACPNWEYLNMKKVPQAKNLFNSHWLWLWWRWARGLLSITSTIRNGTCYGCQCEKSISFIKSRKE